MKKLNSNVVRITALLIVLFTIATNIKAQMYESKPDNIKVDYDDVTLQKFVMVNMEMSNEQVVTKDRITAIIKESKLSQDQFNRMFGAMKMGDTTTYGGASKADVAEFKKTSKKVFDVQQAFADKMKVAIRRQGLQLVEFNQITMAYQNNEKLRNKVDLMFQAAMKK